MSSALLILIGANSLDASLRWARINRHSGEVLAHGELAAGDVSPVAPPAETVLIIPGTEAQLKSVQLAAGSDVQARAAASYLFEGALAIEKEDAVFALGSESNGRRLVAAVDRRRLQRWIDKCNGLDANPGSIFLDSSIWPVSAGTVQVVALDERVIVSGGELGSFAIEPDLAPALIPAWLAQTPGEVAVVEVSGIDASMLASRLSQPAPPVEPIALDDPMMTLCRAASAPAAYAPDLRQGEFAIVRRKGAGIGAWGLAAALAITAATLQLGVMTADGFRDAQAAEALSASNDATFLQLRPNTKRITNLRAQVTAALNAARRAEVNPAIYTSSLVAGVLRSHPDVRLDEVRRDTPGKLVTLRFSSAQTPAMDAAMADLGAAIANLKIGQMQANEGRVNLTASVEAS